MANFNVVIESNNVVEYYIVYCLHWECGWKVGGQTEGGGLRLAFGSDVERMLRIKAREIWAADEHVKAEEEEEAASHKGDLENIDRELSRKSAEHDNRAKLRS